MPPPIRRWAWGLTFYRYRTSVRPYEILGINDAVAASFSCIVLQDYAFVRQIFCLLTVGRGGGISVPLDSFFICTWEMPFNFYGGSAGIKLLKKYKNGVSIHSIEKSRISIS